MSIASRAMWLVSTARVSTEVCDVSKRKPSAAITSPALRASSLPLSFKPTSCHPVNRLSRFHSLSPWRSRTSVPVMPGIVERSEPIGSGRAVATVAVMPLVFDRFIRYDELSSSLHALAQEHPGLVTVEEYGRSYEGRSLLLVTVTDASTGAHDTKPAHWVDANIHAVEVTGGAAAIHLLHHLVTASERGDQTTLEALRTRTFYVVPRVNPDGVEAALADSPSFRRSSMRPWPYSDRHRWPGLLDHDVDGDGRVLTMRIVDP